MNKQFQQRPGQNPVRSGIVVRPLTVLNIHDLESIIHSAEAEDFDFIYALHHRTVRDTEVLSDLLEVLSSFDKFGKKPSPRLKEVLERLHVPMFTYLFPKEKIQN